MADRFQIFRLSLIPRLQRDLLEQDVDRQTYLNRLFRNDWKFEYWGSTFHYVLDQKLSAENFILGRLGKATLVDENLPPESGFVEIVHEGWKACVIAVDPTEHADGQKVSVQVDLKVGKPFSILKGFVGFLNDSNHRAQYEIEVSPIFDSQSFWSFVAENEGEITRLTFDFITPNGIWSAETNLKTELKLAKEKFNATKISNTFENKEGLSVNNQEIHEAVDYAQSGSGKIKAKTKKNKFFNSSQQQKFVDLPYESGTDNERMIMKAARQISRVFGRE